MTVSLPLIIVGAWLVALLVWAIRLYRSAGRDYMRRRP